MRRIRLVLAPLCNHEIAIGCESVTAAPPSSRRPPCFPAFPAVALGVSCVRLARSADAPGVPSPSDAPSSRECTPSGIGRNSARHHPARLRGACRTPPNLRRSVSCRASPHSVTLLVAYPGFLLRRIRALWPRLKRHDAIHVFQAIIAHEVFTISVQSKALKTFIAPFCRRKPQGWRRKQ